MVRFSNLAACAAAILVAGASGAWAQPQPARLGGHPNLNGIWQAMSGADNDLEPHSTGPAPAAPELLGALVAVPAGVGVVEGGTIPYLPDAVAQRKTNRESAPKGDPEAACYLPGIPRASYAKELPFQIVQGDTGDMLMVYEYANANRTIYMQKTEEPPIDTWMGTSYGQWEGNTLRVETLGQNGMTWLDRAGNYLSPTAKVTERFTLIDPTHMNYEATIEDPSVYSKPWKISMPLYKHVERNAQLLEFNCVPFSELLVYGDLLPKPQGAK